MSKKKKKSKSVKRTYEAAQTSRFRKQPTQSQSADAAVDLAGPRLRAWARHLDENHDIATGILNTLTDNIVGSGVTVEPMVVNKNGTPNEKINDQIREAWEEWAESPEVTAEMTMGEVERLVCRSWLRDGEVLVQKVMGDVAGLQHLGGIPFSLELIESDYLPFDLHDQALGIVHGVQKNAWGRPRNYYLYKDHPGNNGIYGLGAFGSLFPSVDNTKTVSADRILHIKFARRIKQTRGVTCLHSVITRLDDIKDFEESERIKARVQAAFTTAITKPLESTAPVNADGDRTFEMSAGMVFDGLNPGESVVSMEASSPTALLKDYRAEMLRAAAAGTGASYSSISKDYNGTYSAQRQELVESQPAYRRLREYFISAFTRPVYRAFVDMAILSGKVSVPRTMPPRSLYAADFGTVAMPWIDPVKEAQAIQLLLEMGLESKSAAIRARGKNPRMVKEQIEQDEPLETEEPEETEEPDEAQAMEEQRVMLRSVAGEQRQRPQVFNIENRMPDVVVNNDVAAPVIPEQLAPIVNVEQPVVNVEQPVVNIEHTMPDITVNNQIPGQEAPVVRVRNEMPEQPTINVNVPTQPVPDVVVNNQIDVPQQAAPAVIVQSPPAPDVTVNMESPETERQVTFRRDRDGNITKAIIKDD